MTATGDSTAEDVPVVAPTPDPGDPAEPTAPAEVGPSSPTRLTGRLRLVWSVGVLAFTAQAVGLLAWSDHLWSHYDLTSDFGTFSQAWQQIGTGHRIRETTFAYNYPHYGYPFWQSHFELIMWPLALLHLLWSSTFVLLVVQDLALAGIGLAGLRFGLELLERQWPTGLSHRTVVGAGVLVVLLVSPWVYWTASFDFHLQPIAILLVVLCARDVWNGRRRAWWFAAAVLACGDVAASYLVGLGIAAVLSGRPHRLIGTRPDGRRRDVGGRGRGHRFGQGVESGGELRVPRPCDRDWTGRHLRRGVGIAHHPTGALDVLRARRDEIVKFIASSGSIGLVSALGFGMTVVVLVPNALNQSAVFIGAAAAFQNLAAVVFLIVGGVTLLTWLARRNGWGPVVMWIVAAVALVQTAVVSAQWISKIPANSSR